jgi:hypothetical protein
MTHSLTAQSRTFWIAHSTDDLQSGMLAPGERISTGLDHLETHNSALVQRQRLDALKRDYPKALAEWLETLRLRDPFAKLADHRWRYETAGLDLPGGQRIQTTRESQAQITAVINSLQLSLITEPVTYKLDSGWAELTTAQVTAVAQAVGAHVKACFRAERVVAAQLDAMDDPTKADVAGLFQAAYLAEMTE